MSEMTIAEMVEFIEECAHDHECSCDDDTEEVCISCLIESVLEDTSEMLAEVVEQLEMLEN